MAINTHRYVKRGVHITLDCKVLKKIKEQMNTDGFCLSRYVNAMLNKKFISNKNKVKMKREEFIAEVQHIAWVAYQIAAGQPYNIELNEDQLKSLLNAIKFQDEHPNNTPKQNHENWMKMKISQGWKYGTVKCFEKKEHPDIKPYNELPRIEQQKDLVNSIAHKLAVNLWDALEQ